ncbi:MAG: hypothetical protein ACE5LC_02920 [Candidatus Aminicenantales bacterium]
MINSLGRLFCSSLILGVTIFISLSPLQSQQKKPRVVVAKENALLRVYPSPESPAIRKIAVGTVLEVVKPGWEWLRVKLPADSSGISLVGYINERFVSYKVEEIPAPERKEVVVVPREAKPEKPRPKVVPEKKVAQAPLMVKKHRLVSIYGCYGWDYVSGGDLNRVIHDRNKFYSDSDNYFPLTDYRSEWKDLSWLNNFRGEFIFNFTPTVSLGLGVDFITDTTRGTLTQQQSTEETIYTTSGYHIDKTVFSSNIQPSYTLRLLPFTLNLRLSIPLTGLLSACFSAGAGYYLGKLNLNASYEEDADFSQKYYLNDGTFLKEWVDNRAETGNYKEEVKAEAVGIHGGLGVYLKITRNISFVVEALYRVVSLKDWRGNFSHLYDWNTESGWSDTGIMTESGSVSESEAGSLWYSEVYYDYLAKYYAEMKVLSVGPSPGTGIRNIRHAVLNLSGFVLRWGIKVNI